MLFRLVNDVTTMDIIKCQAALFDYYKIWLRLSPWFVLDGGREG